MARDYRVHLTPVPHTKSGNKGTTVRCSRVSGLCYTSLHDVEEFLLKDGKMFTIRNHGEPLDDASKFDVVVFLSVKEFLRDDGKCDIPCAVILDGPLSLSSIKGIDILDINGDPWESGTRFTLESKAPNLVEITERAAAVGGYHVLRVNNGHKGLECATNGALYQKISTMLYNHGDLELQRSIFSIVERILLGEALLDRDALIQEIQDLSGECHPTRVTFIERSIDGLLSPYGQKVCEAYRYVPDEWEEDDEAVERNFGIEKGDLTMLKAAHRSFKQ